MRNLEHGRDERIKEEQWYQSYKKHARNMDSRECGTYTQ